MSKTTYAGLSAGFSSARFQSRQLWSASEPGGAVTPSRVKILIVEDNAFLAMEVEAFLAGSGFEVVGVAETGGQAIEMAEASRPDLAIMDIRLPGGSDGVETALVLYEKFGLRSLFASAHEAAEVQDRAKAARAAGWLTKPYTMPALAEAIRTALEKFKN